MESHAEASRQPPTWRSASGATGVIKGERREEMHVAGVGAGGRLGAERVDRLGAQAVPLTPAGFDA